MGELPSIWEKRWVLGEVGGEDELFPPFFLVVKTSSSSWGINGMTFSTSVGALKEHPFLAYAFSSTIFWMSSFGSNSWVSSKFWISRPQLIVLRVGPSWLLQCEEWVRYLLEWSFKKALFNDKCPFSLWISNSPWTLMSFSSKSIYQ